MRLTLTWHKDHAEVAASGYKKLGLNIYAEQVAAPVFQTLAGSGFSIVDVRSSVKGEGRPDEYTTFEVSAEIRQDSEPVILPQKGV